MRKNGAQYERQKSKDRTETIGPKNIKNIEKKITIFHKTQKAEK